MAKQVLVQEVAANGESVGMPVKQEMPAAGIMEAS